MATGLKESINSFGDNLAALGKILQMEGQKHQFIDKQKELAAQIQQSQQQDQQDVLTQIAQEKGIPTNQPAGNNAVQIPPQVAMPQPVDQMQLLAKMMQDPSMQVNDFARAQGIPQMAQAAMLPFQMRQMSAQARKAEEEVLPMGSKSVNISTGQTTAENPWTYRPTGIMGAYTAANGGDVAAAIDQMNKDKVTTAGGIASAQQQAKVTRQVVTDNQGNATLIEKSGIGGQPTQIPLGRIGKSSTSWKPVKNAAGATVALYNPVTKETQLPGDIGLNSFSDAPLTSNTKTMVETAPRVTSLLDNVARIIKEHPNEVGPAMGRWNEYITGKVGAPNPIFSELKTYMSLASTLAMKMHTGSRGSEYMLAEFKDLMDSPQQSPGNILAKIQAIKQYAGEVAGEANVTSPLKETPQATSGKTIKLKSGRTITVE